jgi:hypothetical protein
VIAANTREELEKQFPASSGLFAFTAFLLSSIILCDQNSSADIPQKLPLPSVRKMSVFRTEGKPGKAH